MSKHADKIQEARNRTVAHEGPETSVGSDTTFQFVDKRPEAVAQRKVQEMANNSPQVMQLKAIQKMANDSSEVVQRLGWDDLVEAGTTIADELLGEGTAEAVVHAINPYNAMNLNERAILILAAAGNATMANLSTVMGALGADAQLVELVENAEEARDIDQLG
ncbi:hypothetical protein N9933_02430 [bacterium]|nr:hypothetical protein [bacterium]